MSWTILLKIKMKLVTMRQDRIQIGENTKRSRLVANVEGIFLSKARPGKITFASVFALMIEFVRKYLHYPAKVLS